MTRKDTQSSKKKAVNKGTDANAAILTHPKDADPNSKAFNCSYCGEKFHNKGGLLNHLRVAHYGSEQRNKPETRKSHSLRALGLHNTSKSAPHRHEELDHAKPHSKAAKPPKKGKPPSKSNQRDLKLSDAILGKRDPSQFEAETNLKVDEQFSDQTTRDSANCFKRKSGGASLETDKTARTRAAGNPRSHFPATKTEDFLKVHPSFANKVNCAGKRGRPRKNRADAVEQGPANWKWRSNVCIQIKKIDPVECSYHECRKVVSSVSSADRSARSGPATCWST